VAPSGDGTNQLLGLGRIQLQRSVQMGQGFLRLAARFQGQGQVIVGQGMVG
jgi:hypothetical protein